MDDSKNIFENIIAAARRSMDWKLNLILTPAELEVMVVEISRLQTVVAEYADHSNWCARNDRPDEDYDLWLPNENGYTRAENALKDGER